MTFRTEINLALTLLIMFIVSAFSGLILMNLFNAVTIGGWLLKAAISFAIGWLYLVNDIENNHEGEEP